MIVFPTHSEFENMSHFVTQGLSHEDQHIDSFRNPGPGGFLRMMLVCDSSV